MKISYNNALSRITDLTKHTEFTKSQVAKALGITPRTVHFYTDEGLVKPEIADPHGRGTKRKYSAKNLVELLVIKELVAHGLSLADVKHILSLPGEPFGPGPDSDSFGFDPWNPEEEMPFSRFYLVVYDHTTDHGRLSFMAVGGEGPLQLDMENRQSAVVIDLNQLRERAREIL